MDLWVVSRIGLMPPVAPGSGHYEGLQKTGIAFSSVSHKLSVLQCLI